MCLKNHLFKLYSQSDFILFEAKVTGDTNVRRSFSGREIRALLLKPVRLIWYDAFSYMYAQALGIMVLFLEKRVTEGQVHSSACRKP